MSSSVLGTPGFGTGGAREISTADADVLADEDPLASELGVEAVNHRGTLEEVKRLLGIRHRHLDCWLYAFLENKAFNVPETMAKLERRATMEVMELGAHKVTSSLYEGLRRGIIQIIGCDKRGRLCLYVCSARNFPDAKKREENTQSFDIVLSYATRLRSDHKSCRFVMLVNQKDAGLIKNMDLPFQASIALRISKYFPGLLEKIYIVNMSRIVTTLLKPIFQGMPAVVSERIRIISDSDLRHGTLLQWFDASVLPVALGGTMDKDTPVHWCAFADTVTSHFERLQDAIVRRSMGVKEWELEELQKHEEGWMEASGVQTSSLGRAADMLQRVAVQSESSRRVVGGATVSSTQSCSPLSHPLLDAYDGGVVEEELMQQRGVIKPVRGAFQEKQQKRFGVQMRHRQLTDRVRRERQLMMWLILAIAVLCLAVVVIVIVSLWRLGLVWWVWLGGEDLILICMGVAAGVGFSYRTSGTYE